MSGLWVYAYAAQWIVLILMAFVLIGILHHVGMLYHQVDELVPIDSAMPSTVDIRPIVRRRLAERERNRAHPSPRRAPFWLVRAAAALALCAFLGSGAVAVAAAASPKLCGDATDVCRTFDRLARSAAASWSLLLAASPSYSSQVTEGSGTGIGADQGTIAVAPTPSFQVLATGYVPDGLTHREYAYLPSRPSGSVPPKAAAGSEGTSASARSLEAVKRLGEDQRGGVWLRFASPTGDRFLEVSEQPLRPGQSLPTGETVDVGGGKGVVQSGGDQTIVTLIRSGTAITIRTNLGRLEALRVAQSLH